MTDEVTDPQAGATTPTEGGAQEKAAPQKTEVTENETPVSGDVDKGWLTTEITKVRKEAAKYRTELRAIQQQVEADKRKQLEAQGNWQSLYEQAKADLAAREQEVESASAYKQAFEAVLQNRINAIPEANRALIPTDYEPIKLSAWLDANWERLGARRAPNLDAGAGGQSSSSNAPKLDPIKLDLARKLNIDPAKLG